MLTRTTGLLAAIAMLAPSCKVGPKYQRPSVPLNAGWLARDPRLVADVAVDAAWWKSFGDPTLDQLIDRAHQQNLPLQIAGLRILEARAELGIAVGEFWPKNVDPIAKAQAVGLSDQGQNVDRRFGTYQVGFDAVWELDLWGKFRNGIDAAKASYLATIADYDGAIVSLSAEVARTYVVIRTFEVLIDQANDNVGIQQEGLDIALSRFRNGATSELDVAQATTQLETTRATIPQLQASLEQSQNAMSTLLGEPTGRVQAMLKAPHGIPTPPARVGVSMPAELLWRRPDIRAAELRAIAECARVGVAKAELYPSLVLFGSIGTTATSHVSTGNSSLTTNGHSTFSNLFGPGSLVYNAGGSLFWPLLNRRQIKYKVRAELARFQQTLVQYAQTVRVAAQEVDDGISGFLHQQDAVTFAENAVTSADLAVKLAMIQYREGAIDFQRVLDSQQSRLDAQNRLANTRSAAVTNLIALYKALGGGWNTRAEPQKGTGK